jgi:hypothetical protein
MSSFYLSITSISPPMNISLDPSARKEFVFNVTAKARAPVVSWSGDLTTLITTAGLGITGTDLFIGPGAVIPDGDGPITHITPTGGLQSNISHGATPSTRSIHENFSAQIVVRAEKYTTAEMRANAIWRLLDNQRNVTV